MHVKYSLRSSPYCTWDHYSEKPIEWPCVAHPPVQQRIKAVSYQMPGKGKLHNYECSTVQSHRVFTVHSQELDLMTLRGSPPNQDIVVLWFHASTILWFFDFMTLWFYGSCFQKFHTWLSEHFGTQHRNILPRCTTRPMEWLWLSIGYWLFIYYWNNSLFHYFH